MNAAREPLVVWRLVDGKPGHENQSLGLVEALQRRCSVQAHTLCAPPPWQALGHWLLGRFPPGRSLPDPALLIGAGHRTHAALLAARRARGGRTVVLMKPTLPLGWFDFVAVPEHDRVASSSQVLVTRGVLNRLRPAERKDPGCGLILVGGPSAHFQWLPAQLEEQIRAIVDKDGRRWIVATSRRTPEDTRVRLQALADQQQRVQLVPWQETGPGWLPEQLARTPVAWVTEDSVSMVYEALTAGAACGLLEVPARGASRVSRGVASLRQADWVTTFGEWRTTDALPAPPAGFNEADRCARWILEHVPCP